MPRRDTENKPSGISISQALSITVTATTIAIVSVGPLLSRTEKKYAQLFHTIADVALNSSASCHQITKDYCVASPPFSLIGTQARCTNYVTQNENNGAFEASSTSYFSPQTNLASGYAITTFCLSLLAAYLILRARHSTASLRVRSLTLFFGILILLCAAALPPFSQIGHWENPYSLTHACMDVCNWLHALTKGCFIDNANCSSYDDPPSIPHDLFPAPCCESWNVSAVSGFVLAVQLIGLFMLPSLFDNLSSGLRACSSGLYGVFRNHTSSYTNLSESGEDTTGMELGLQQKGALTSYQTSL